MPTCVLAKRRDEIKKRGRVYHIGNASAMVAHRPFLSTLLFCWPPMVTVSIPLLILQGIADECDRYPSEETGGRLLGFYTQQQGDLHIDVKAVIAAGPNARRTRVSLFQDGEYQERIFRAVEKVHPAINHLGNWHTHHVNGLRTLSYGDCETYHKCVNSPKHNTDFFYALLVTHRVEMRKYAVKHFVFRRNEPGHEEVYNIVVGGKVLQL